MNLIIIGPQGCGKGTQALKLAEKFNLEHLEMGHLLRSVAGEDSELGSLINELINIRKELAPDDVVMSALGSELGKMSLEKGIIIDGVPRTIKQIGLTEKVMAECGRSVIDKVISIKLPREVSMERITRRFACKECRKRLVLGNDIQDASEKCPDCGGEIYQRSDDSPEGVSKRLDIYYNETVPVIEYYRNKGVLVEVDGDKGIEEVFEDIVRALGN